MMFSCNVLVRIVAEGEEPDAVVRLDYGQVAEKAVYYKSGSEKYGRAAKYVCSDLAISC